MYFHSQKNDDVRTSRMLIGQMLRSYDKNRSLTDSNDVDHIVIEISESVSLQCDWLCMDFYSYDFFFVVFVFVIVLVIAAI